MSLCLFLCRLCKIDVTKLPSVYCFLTFFAWATTAVPLQHFFVISAQAAV